METGRYTELEFDNVYGTFSEVTYKKVTIIGKPANSSVTNGPMKIFIYSIIQFCKLQITESHPQELPD